MYAGSIDTDWTRLVYRAKKNLRKIFDASLLIYLLSYLLPTSKIKPRRLLTQHKISFSLQDNSSSLRQKLKAFIKTLEKGKCREEKQAAQLAMEIETR